MNTWIDPDGTLHDNGKLIFLVGSDLIGETPFDPGEAYSLRWRRQGICYFCPTCGEVWGRISLVDSAGKTASYEVYTVACEKHPDQWNMPGSFLTKALSGLMRFLPATVAKRELELRGEATTVP